VVLLLVCLAAEHTCSGSGVVVVVVVVVVNKPTVFYPETRTYKKRHLTQIDIL